ncbi:MAG: radical SAM protein [Candidatus Omnitrophota bacterium]
MRILLIAYDNGSYIHDFPLGLAYIAAVLKNKGIDIEIYSQDLNHYPESHLTQYLNRNKFDLTGIGVIGGYYQYRKLLLISQAVNKSKNRPFYVIAGHGPAPEPEYFLRKTQADCVVIGEGERVILNLIDALISKKSLKSVRGIAYRKDGNIFINNREPLIEDLENIPQPAYDLFPIEYYRLLSMPKSEKNDFVMPVITGRGCPFKCNFCYRMDEGLRLRSSKAVLDEIEFLKNKYSINYIMFSDDLLMSSLGRTEELCREFIRARLKIKWYCNGRLNYARADILKLMKEAGCVFINYGIEAMDDEILKAMNKALTVKMIKRGIEETLKAGISPGYNIIFGNIGENKKTLDKGVEFLIKYDDGAQLRTIRPVTPYPGSELYYYAIKRGLLKDCRDFYENKHLNSDLLSVNFTELTDEEFYSSLFEANSKLISNYFNKKKESVINQAKNLYINKDISFRGFRQT